MPGILDVIGVGMLGPTIIAHGTDEQKERYLGPMLHGDEVWCQLFSEPAAGSDLAGVQTRARENDDGTWALNGQKVWTTNAQFASFGLLLARTDADEPKHKGLTMFIVPMDAPGRDDPRAAPDLRRGRVQRGLLRRRRAGPRCGRRAASAAAGATALTTLMFERLTIGRGLGGLRLQPGRFAAAMAARRGAQAPTPRCGSASATSRPSCSRCASRATAL